ncbi:MAG: flagellar biosynthesis protein FlhB [Sphingopyxis sp.]
MAEAPGGDKTEAPTPKRKREAVEKGDVLQSRELGTALVMLVGAGWIAFAGPWMVGSIKVMLTDGLTLNAADVQHFAPGDAIARLTMGIILPLMGIVAATFFAAIAAPAMVGSLGFRTGAFAFKPDRLNPMNGLGRIFGAQGLIELGKSLAKVVALGAIGWWLLDRQMARLFAPGGVEPAAQLAAMGSDFVFALLIMSGALGMIALVDVPTQFMQRMKRLLMTKQEVRDEHKQTEGSPELKAAIRRRQYEVLSNSARSAVAEATVVLTNPTHFAIALRYRPGQDAAPVVVARGVDATAAAIRALAEEKGVIVLSYPQLARAIYFTTRTGQQVREDLYMAVAMILAFVFNLDAARRDGAQHRMLGQPAVDVPPDARFDANGRPER